MSPTKQTRILPERHSSSLHTSKAELSVKKTNGFKPLNILQNPPS